ncbi:MAG: pilus assembly protein PilM [Candidatus Uhrbacteria bacterium]
MVRECNLLPDGARREKGYAGVRGALACHHRGARRAFDRIVQAEHVVGLEIACDAVRACHIERDGARVCIVQTIEAKLPGEIIVGGSIVDAHGLTDVLRTLRSNLLDGGMPEHARVVLGITGHEFIAKTINLPKMSDDEFGASLQWEAEQYIPFDINDVYLAFERQRAATGPRRCADNTEAIVLCAAKRNLVDDYVKVCTDAGFWLDAVEPEAWALCRTLRHAPFYEVERDQCVAVVNLSGEMSTLAVMDVDGNTAFMRNISFGIDEFVRALQSGQELEQADAEQLFTRVLERAGKAFRDEGDELDDAVELVRETATKFSRNVARMLDFFGATHVEPTIGGVLLTGYAIRVPGFLEAITNIDPLPRGVAITLSGTGCVDGGTAAYFGQAFGHALRTSWDRGVTPTGHDADSHPRSSRRNPIDEFMDTHQPEDMSATIARGLLRVMTLNRRLPRVDLASVFRSLAFCARTGVLLHDRGVLALIMKDGTRLQRRTRAVLGMANADGTLQKRSIVPTLRYWIRLPAVIDALLAIHETSDPETLATVFAQCAEYLE